MSNFVLIPVIYYSLFIILLPSCCNESYEFKVPVEILSPRSEYKIGDTLFFQVKMDRRMVYDSTTNESYYIPEFNPYIQFQNVVIDSFPTHDDLDSSKVICFDSQYEYLYFSKSSSFGIIVDQPNIVSDSILIHCGIVIGKTGTHMMYFDSQIIGLRNGFDFSDRCSNSTTGAYPQLMNHNNEYILTQNNKNVIDAHFSGSSGIKRRSAKYYYHVVE